MSDAGDRFSNEKPSHIFYPCRCPSIICVDDAFSFITTNKIPPEDESGSRMDDSRVDGQGIFQARQIVILSETKDLWGMTPRFFTLLRMTKMKD
jgi:hypothetical protein